MNRPKLPRCWKHQILLLLLLLVLGLDVQFRRRSEEREKEVKSLIEDHTLNKLPLFGDNTALLWSEIPGHLFPHHFTLQLLLHFLAANSLESFSWCAPGGI
uniref:Uncharacterized protein n=1 Tax=Opuntia streptacantha TaxID=393608 RepID=A0A7C9A0D5_OPUST